MPVKPMRNKWKGTMTGRQRFINQMHYKPVDRCFNMEFGFWQENYKQWDIFIKNGITDHGQAHDFFGMDEIKTMYTNLWMDPPFKEEVIETTKDKQIITNADGVLAEIQLAGGGSSIPHFIKPTIVTPEDWKKCKAERFRLDSPERKIDIAKMKALHPEDREYPLGVYVGSMIGRIRDMLTFEGLAYACADYPEMVEDMVESCCQIVENQLDQVLPHFKFEYADGWEDICFKNGPIVTVDFFNGVVVPRYKRLRKKLAAAGVDIWYVDCDGDVRFLLKGFMESGINCLFPYEVNSCAHPAELLAEYGKDLRIMGGFDKIEMIKGKEAIKAYMESIAGIVERGGYIPFCDHRCPPDVTPENYLYYLDLKEKMFGMK